MAEGNANQFSHRFYADDPLPDSHEREANSRWTLKPSHSVERPKSPSLLSVFHDLAADDPAHSDRDNHSVSSTNVEAEDQSMLGSGHLSVPGSRSITPLTQPGDQLLSGVGSGHDTRLRSRLDDNLVQVYSDYQKRFVKFRKDQACARLQAVLSERFGFDLREHSFQVAVFSHDELCWSNGAERMEEEQAAICMAIEQEDNKPTQFTRAFVLPPGSYNLPDRGNIRVPQLDITAQEASAPSN